MSKRFVFNQQHGDRKKAKLDVTISDHNFPLSQNSNIREPDQDNWGDENDDEILLLASQACEEAYNDISSLPDYSICMQPGTTSTQFEPKPSTSKAAFIFKKPTANPPNAISTHLKNKCKTISSPLPGMTNKVITNPDEKVSFSDDLVFNDKIFKGQDPDFMYRQLLQLQEENTKLKSENGKLLEKCVTKEGEASILRTQLKSCQVAVDNARMEKIKTQERVEAEWTVKLTTANSQMCDLRNQLDFKNLEIISIKEKCKKLESNKLKLTQVTVGNNDISASHKYNNNAYCNESMTQMRRVQKASSAVQTDHKAGFLKLNRILRKENSKLISILPLILENCNEQHHSILDYNEKLQKQSDYSQTKCRVFSTFHRVPSSPVPGREVNKSKVNLSHIYEDLTFIAAKEGDGESTQIKYFNVFRVINCVLQDVQNELDAISQRVTNAFQKEMDERYIEATSMYLTVNGEDLLKSRALYKDEQGILMRRLTTIVAYALETTESFEMFKLYEEKQRGISNKFMDSINRICNLLDSTSCAVLYSGFLLSLTILLNKHLENIPDSTLNIMEITKVILSSRPMPFVSTNLLFLIRRLSAFEYFLSKFCPGSNSSNLKVDYDQGVLLYKKDSCYLQVLIKQIELSLKCIEAQNLTNELLRTTRHLIGMYSNVSGLQKTKCDCQIMLIQVIVFALRICAVMLKNLKDSANTNNNRELISICRSGVQVLYQCSLRDVEFGSQLTHNEGHLIDFCEIVKGFDHSEIYCNMLSELTSTFHASPEEAPSSYHKQPWLKSFKAFSIAD